MFYVHVVHVWIYFCDTFPLKVRRGQQTQFSILNFSPCSFSEILSSRNKFNSVLCYVYIAEFYSVLCYVYMYCGVLLCAVLRIYRGVFVHFLCPLPAVLYSPIPRCLLASMLSKSSVHCTVYMIQSFILQISPWRQNCLQNHCWPLIRGLYSILYSI